MTSNEMKNSSRRRAKIEEQKEEVIKMQTPCPKSAEIVKQGTKEKVKIETHKFTKNETSS